MPTLFVVEISLATEHGRVRAVGVDADGVYFLAERALQFFIEKELIHILIR